MKKRKVYSLLLLLVSVLVGGCASFGKSDLAHIEKATNPKTGLSLTQSNKAEDMEIKKVIEPMLKGELTLDSALRIGLMNNPMLQGVYQELGIAKADLLQATLFHNPRFEGHARAPKEEGKTNVELVLAQDVMSVLLMPLRRRVASAEFAEAKLRTSDAVISLMAEIKTAYYELLAAGQVKHLRSLISEASGAAREMAERLSTAGNINAIELGTQKSFHEQAVIDLMQSEYDAKIAREPLNRLLGLHGSYTETWQVTHVLPELPESDPELKNLEELALKERLDYAAVRQEIEVMRRALFATRLGIIPEGEVGFNTEREPDGDRVSGPMWWFPVPIFDFQQAATSRAKSELRLSEFKASAFEVDVLSQVRQTREKMLTYRKVAERYQSHVIPVRQQLVEALQLHYNYMLKGVFELLQGKKDEIEAEREYIEVLRNYWIARTELERAVGGKLPEGGMGESKETPTVSPTEPAQKMDHGGYHQ